MLTIDHTEQRKSGDQRCSVRSDRIAVDDVASSKIIILNQLGKRSKEIVLWIRRRHPGENNRHSGGRERVGVQR